MSVFSTDPNWQWAQCLIVSGFRSYSGRNCVYQSLKHLKSSFCWIIKYVSQRKTITETTIRKEKAANNRWKSVAVNAEALKLSNRLLKSRLETWHLDESLKTRSMSLTKTPEDTKSRTSLSQYLWNSGNDSKYFLLIISTNCVGRKLWVPVRQKMVSSGNRWRVT